MCREVICKIYGRLTAFFDVDGFTEGSCQKARVKRSAQASDVFLLQLRHCKLLVIVSFIEYDKIKDMIDSEQ